MKVSTRVISGFGVLMILASLALVYQVSVLRQLRSITRESFLVNQQAIEAMTRMRYEVETIDEFSRKYFSIDREHYGRELEAWWEQFETDLNALQRMPGSVEERSN